MKSILIYFSLVEISIKTKLQHPFLFVIEMITTIMMFVAEFITVYLFASKIGNLNGWTSNQLAVMYIFTVCAGAIQNCFTNGLRGFSSQLLSGNFDTQLIRPVHPLIVLLGNIYVGAIAIIVFCICIICYLFITIPTYFSFIKVIWFIISIIGGSMIFSSLNIVSSGLAYWTYDSEIFFKITKNGTRQLLWYPIDIYGTIIRDVITYVIPLAFIGYFPSYIITDKTITGFPSFLPYLSLPIGVICFTLSIVFWNKGLKHYQTIGI